MYRPYPPVSENPCLRHIEHIYISFLAWLGMVNNRKSLRDCAEIIIRRRVPSHFVVKGGHKAYFLLGEWTAFKNPIGSLKRFLFSILNKHVQ